MSNKINSGKCFLTAIILIIFLYAPQVSLAQKKCVKDDFDRCKIYQTIISYVDSFQNKKDPDRDTILVKPDWRIYRPFINSINSHFEKEYLHYVKDTIFKQLKFIETKSNKTDSLCQYNVPFRYISADELNGFMAKDRTQKIEMGELVLYKPASIQFSGLFTTSNPNDIVIFAINYYDNDWLMYFFTFVIERVGTDYRVKKVYLRKI